MPDNYYNLRRKPRAGTPINWSHPLANGLVFSFPINECGGLTLYDATGKNNPVTGGQKGGPLTWGSFGNATIPAIANAGFVGTLSTTFNSSAFTVEGLFSLGTLLTGSNGLRSLEMGNTGGGGLGISLSSGYQSSKLCAINDPVAWVPTSSTATINTLYHSALVYQSGSMTLYLGGLPVYTGAVSVGGSGNISTYQFNTLETGDKNYQNAVAKTAMYSRALSASEVKKLATDPFCMYHADAHSVIRTLALGSLHAYTLAAGAASFATAGRAAGVTAARKVAASAGSFTETGQAAGVTAARKVAAAAGSFSETGQAAGVTAARKVAAAAGSFSETGQAAGMKLTHVLIASAGSFATTGKTATLTYTANAAPSADLVEALAAFLSTDPTIASLYPGGWYNSAASVDAGRDPAGQTTRAYGVFQVLDSEWQNILKPGYSIETKPIHFWSMSPHADAANALGRQLRGLLIGTTTAGTFTPATPFTFTDGTETARYVVSGSMQSIDEVPGLYNDGCFRHLLPVTFKVSRGG